MPRRLHSEIFLSRVREWILITSTLGLFFLGCTHVSMTAEELQQYRDHLLQDCTPGRLYVPRRFTALPESGNLSSDLEFRSYGCESVSPRSRRF
jgi:hypothetical protein